MKKWTNPEVKKLDLKKTEHKWTGVYRDGGYIGDGEISGHLSWTKPESTQSPKPTEIPDQLS